MLTLNSAQSAEAIAGRCCTRSKSFVKSHRERDIVSMCSETSNPFSADDYHDESATTRARSAGNNDNDARPSSQAPPVWCFPATAEDAPTSSNCATPDRWFRATKTDEGDLSADDGQDVRDERRERDGSPATSATSSWRRSLKLFANILGSRSPAKPSRSEETAMNFRGDRV